LYVLLGYGPAQLLYKVHLEVVLPFRNHPGQFADLFLKAGEAVLSIVPVALQDIVSGTGKQLHQFYHLDQQDRSLGLGRV
jgi:hypothetical protein